jgi:hypothetical protein
MEKKWGHYQTRENEVETPVVDSFENNGQVEIRGTMYRKGQAGSLKKWFR